MSEHAARSAIAWAIDSPWGAATTQATRLDQWTEVATEAAVKALARGREPVSFRGDAGVKIHISSFRRRAGISTAAPADMLDGDKAASILVDWLRLLDMPELGWASADPDPGGWYHEQRLPVAPPQLGMHVRWLHALPPGWDRNLDPTVIRGLDGCTLTVADGGIALLRVFDDPLSHAEPEVREQRRRVSEAVRGAVR